MRVDIRRPRRTGRAVALLVAAVLAGCAGPVAVTPSIEASALATSVPPSATVAPPSSGRPVSPPTPASTPTVGQRWELIDGPAHASLDDAVYGDAGWVAVGQCVRPECPSGADVASAWFSRDGASWSVAHVERPANALFTAVTWNGAYFGAGVRIERVPHDGRVPIWRSADGTSWNLIGTLDRGRCEFGCYNAGPIVALPSGVLVLGWVSTGDVTTSGTYWSRDGSSWSRAELPPLTAHKVENAILDVVVFGSDLVMVSGCRTCPPTVWTSADGASWTQQATLGLGTMYDVDVTATPSAVIAAVESCQLDGCHVAIWTSTDGRAWTQVATRPEMTKLAYGEGALVGIARHESDAYVDVSPDGLDWQLLTLEVPDFGDDCGVDWIAGSPDRLLMGETNCDGVWSTPAD